MRLRTVLGIGAVGMALAATSTAAAQQTQTTTIYRTAPPSGYTAPPSDYVVTEQPHEHPIRFRFGLDATGGAMVRGPEAAFGGLRARLGIQLGDWFAIYYMPTGLVGGFLDTRSANNHVIGQMYNSFMLELTAFDMLQLAAGPSVDFTWGCTDVQSTFSCSDNGPFFGLDGRVAIQITPDMDGLGARRGFTLSADVHPTWYTDDVVGISVLGGLGIEMY